MTAQGKKPRVSGCIVAYNNGEEILTCLDSIRRYTEGVEPELYVVDNGSADNTLALLREQGARLGITVIDNGENKGFGAGHNTVLPLLDSDYHVIINPDITLQEDAITEMVSYMETHPEVGLMMPDILNPDGTRQELPKMDPTWRYHIGGRLSEKIRAEYCRTPEHLTEPAEICFCSGCFSVIRTGLFRKLKGYDPRYFLYLEDADLSREVRKTHKVLFYPKAKVIHAWHGDSHHSWKALRLHLISAAKYSLKWRSL